MLVLEADTGFFQGGGGGGGGRWVWIFHNWTYHVMCGQSTGGKKRDVLYCTWMVDHLISIYLI